MPHPLAGPLLVSQIMEWVGPLTLFMCSAGVAGYYYTVTRKSWNWYLALAIAAIFAILQFLIIGVTTAFASFYGYLALGGTL